MSNFRKLGAVLAGVVLSTVALVAVAPDADAANGLGHSVTERANGLRANGL